MQIDLNDDKNIADPKEHPNYNSAMVKKLEAAGMNRTDIWDCLDAHRQDLQKSHDDKMRADAIAAAKAVGKRMGRI